MRFWWVIAVFAAVVLAAWLAPVVVSLCYTK